MGILNHSREWRRQLRVQSLRNTIGQSTKGKVRFSSRQEYIEACRKAFRRWKSSRVIVASQYLREPCSVDFALAGDIVVSLPVKGPPYGLVMCWKGVSLSNTLFFGVYRSQGEGQRWNRHIARFHAIHTIMAMVDRVGSQWKFSSTAPELSNFRHKRTAVAITMILDRL